MTTKAFRVGQVWQRRDGQTARITEIKDSGFYPVVTEDQTYTWEGRALGGQPTGVDLINLVHDVEEPQPKRPSLAVGQLWRTRSGDIEKIVEIDHSLCYPVTTDSGSTYALGGYFYSEEDEDDYDLVELVEEAEAPQAKQPQFAVGQQWKRRDGQVVRITSISDNLCHTYPVSANDDHSRMLDGRVFNDKLERSADLVELVDEPKEVQPQKHRFAVGQKWRRRNGTVTRVFAVLDGKSLTYPVSVEDGSSYTVDGQFWRHTPNHPLDLVEPVEEAPVEPPAELTSTPQSVRATVQIAHGRYVTSRVLDDGTAWYIRVDAQGLPLGEWIQYPPIN
jgi:hypothetical protein